MRKNERWRDTLSMFSASDAAERVIRMLTLFCTRVVDDHSYGYRPITLARRIHKSNSYGNLASLRSLQGHCKRVTDPADLRSSAFISGLACVACQYDSP